MQNSSEISALVDAQLAALGQTLETMRKLRRTVSMHGAPQCDEIDKAAGIHADCVALRNHYRAMLAALTAQDVVRLSPNDIEKKLELPCEDDHFGSGHQPEHKRAAIESALHDFTSEFRFIAHDMGSSLVDPDMDDGSFRLSPEAALERWSRSVAGAVVPQGAVFEQQARALLALLDCEVYTIVTEKFYERPARW